MAAEEVNIFNLSMMGAFTMSMAFFGFISKRFINKVDATSDRLAQHEKDDIGKYATIDQLSRVHNRIDSMQESTITGFKETQQGLEEIKMLLLKEGRR